MIKSLFKLLSFFIRLCHRHNNSYNSYNSYYSYHMPMVHLFWCMWLVYSYSSIYLSSSKSYTLQWMMANLNCTKFHFFIMCPELLWFAFMYIIGLPHAKSCFLILKCVCWTRSVLVQKRVWLDTVTLTVLMNVRMRGWAVMLLVSAVHIVKMVRSSIR